MYFHISLHLRHTCTAGRHPAMTKSLFLPPSSEAIGPSIHHLLSYCPPCLQDCPHLTRLPASDSPWTILLCEQDIKSLEHCL